MGVRRAVRVWKEVLAPTSQPKETGVTLLEAVASLAIFGMIAVGAYGIESSSMNFYTDQGAKATRVSDTMSVDWTMQKLAQVSVEAGTESYPSDGHWTATWGPTSSPVNVLLLQVSNLASIVPTNSPLYQAWVNSDDICVGLAPINGTSQLCLFPVGYNPTTNATADTSRSPVQAISNGQTDFANTTFSVTTTGFQVNLARGVSRVATYAVPGGSRQANLSLSFAMGASDY